MQAIEFRNVRKEYQDGSQIIQALKPTNLVINKGEFVAIVGPSGSGKSTLLKAISRNLKPITGSVFLDGSDIQKFNSKEFARQLAILHQVSRAPADLTVRDLVEYGRFPYQHWWKGKNEDDEKFVSWALKQTGLEKLAMRRVSTLSGGEQQRAWIAMALAQKPRILLLDEPTTYLDIAHQLEVMKIVTTINETYGMTVIMVLHDINHALQYADEIAVLKDKHIVAQGAPETVLTVEMLAQVFGVRADIFTNRQGAKVLSPVELV